MWYATGTRVVFHKVLQAGRVKVSREQATIEAVGWHDFKPENRP
jgi:hypothetical protein